MTKLLTQLVAEKKEECQVAWNFRYANETNTESVFGDMDSHRQELKVNLDFLEHSIRTSVQEALEAVRVKKLVLWPGDRYSPTGDGFNQAVEEQDKKIKEFLK